MPSASVITRVIGGGAEGAEGIDGDDGRSRRVPVERTGGRYPPPGGRCPNGGRGCCPAGAGGPPGRANAGCCVRTGCDGSGRGPPNMPGVVGRGGAYGARGAWPAPPGRVGDGVRPVAGVAGLAPAAGGVGGCTIRGCVTCGRFAGASGRAGCGVLPGSSMRSRIVGGTNRPDGPDGGATDAAAATGVGGSSIVSSTTGGSSIWGGSGTITTGGASSTTTGGGGSTSITGGGAATTATGTSTGSCSTSGGGGGAAAGAAVSAGTCGLSVLTRRGGPRTGAAGLAGSAFFGAGAFFAVVLAGMTPCSANMSPPGSEMLRCRASRSTNERATTSSIVLEALFSSIP